MRRSIAPLRIFLLLAALASQYAHAEVPIPPQISAAAWLLADARSGRILADHDIDRKLPLADLTKIMTAYTLAAEILNGTISPNDVVPVSMRARQAEGVRMYLQEGSAVKLADLIHGIIIDSANDASIAGAEYTAGSEHTFASLMNKYAQTMGMNNTRFANATGRPDENHYSTARDLFLLSLRLIRDFPEQYDIYQEKEFAYGEDLKTGKPIVQYNRNKLLWRNRSVDGIQTSDSELGYSIIASATRNGMRMIAIVLHAGDDETRLQEAQRLLTYGFHHFETHEIYPIGQVLDDIRVWGGDRKSLSIGIPEAVVLTIPKGQYESLRASVKISGRGVWAPVNRGDILGFLRISMGSQMLQQTPILAAADLQPAGILQRTRDWTFLLLRDLGF